MLSSSRRRRNAFVLLAAVCGSCSQPTAQRPDASTTLKLVTECPVKPGVPVIGDFNGDGAYDVADSVAATNGLFRGGRAPACLGDVDFIADGHLELDDAARLRHHLVTGVAPPPKPVSCESVAAWPEGPCVALELGWDAPARITASRFDAALVVSTEQPVVLGWSASVRATGCKLLSGTTRGTLAGDDIDGPPGLRRLGYGTARAVEGGAITYVELSTSLDLTLPAGRSKVAVFQVETAVPATGCTTCTLTTGDGLSGGGQPLDTVVGAGGYAYRPRAASVSVEVCAP